MDVLPEPEVPVEVVLSMDSAGIAVFAKTPGFTPAKTRLGHSVGQAIAEQFYERSVRCIQYRMKKICSENSQVDCIWSIPETSSEALSWWTQFPSMSQVAGGLGERLLAVDRSLGSRHSWVAFTGTDSPQISDEQFQKLLDRCIGAHGENDKWCVLAPTKDGGFWFLAHNGYFPDQVWLDVNYSCEETYKMIYRNIENAGFYIDEFLPHQYDIDELPDLQRLAKEPMESSLNPLQKELIQWASEVVKNL